MTLAAPFSAFDGFADESTPREPVDQVGAQLADRAEYVSPWNRIGCRCGEPDLSEDRLFCFACCLPNNIRPFTFSETPNPTSLNAPAAKRGADLVDGETTHQETSSLNGGQSAVGGVRSGHQEVRETTRDVG